MKKSILRGLAILGAIANTGCVVTPTRTVTRSVVYTEQPSATVILRERPTVVETVVVAPVPPTPVVVLPPHRHHPHPGWHYPPMHPRFPHPLRPGPMPPPHKTHRGR